MRHPKLKRERVAHIEPGTLVVTGVVTTMQVGRHRIAVTAADMDALADVFKLLKQSPFDPTLARAAGHIRLAEIELDEDL